MSLQLVFWLLKIVFLLALLGWGMIVFYLDPETGGMLVRSAFYVGAFLTIGSVGALLLLALRKRVLGREVANKHKSESVRQGLWLAVLATGLMFLQEQRYLTWWDGLLLLVALLLIELYFLGKRKPYGEKH